VPSRGSTLSRIARAVAERWMVSARVRPPPEKIRSELALDNMVLEIAGLVL
jgi:hypothetical protein